jgi:hypothetical protein
MRRAARKEATSIGTGALRTGCKFYERTCPVLRVPVPIDVASFLAPLLM